tara:strand:+ start:893 stop:1618 length:726 start_codon:yes stop_codon:yes gene_type:complete
MIEDILYTLSNRISVGLTDENNQTFLFSSCSVDNNQVTFTDSIDNVQYTVNITGISILTFSDKSIPYAKDIDEFKKAVLDKNLDEYNIDFFKNNKEDHEQNNLIFDNKVQLCLLYLDQFTDSADIIRSNVLNNNTTDLERLKILGCSEAFDIGTATMEQGIMIRSLFFNLIEHKLSHAIIEIDGSIKEINDKEFEEDAKIIKRDLQDDVDLFRGSMDGVRFDKLFNHWPTLLNPSPFNINV